MSGLLSAHDVTTDTPITLVYGNSELVTYIITSLLSSTRVIHVATHNFVPDSHAHNYTFVKQLDADLLKRLQEKITYGIFFMEQAADQELFKDILSKFVKDSAKVSVIIPVRQTTKFLDAITMVAEHSHISFLLLGDVFSPQLSQTYALSSFIKETIHTRKAAKIADDLTPVYPISLHDLIECVLFSLFGDVRKSRVLFLFYELPQTFISLVYSLRTIEPELSLQWKKSKEKLPEGISYDELHAIVITQTEFTPTHFQIGLSGFQEGVKEFTTAPVVLPRSSRRKILPTSYLQHKMAVLRQKMFLNAVIIGFLLFTLINIGAVFTSVYFAQLAVRDAQSQQLTNALNNAQKALIAFHFAEPTIHYTMEIVFWVAPNSTIVRTYSDLKQQLELTESLLSIIIPKVQRVESGLPAEEFDQLTAEMIQTYFQIEKLSLINGTFERITHDQSYRYTSLLPTISEALGYTGAKTYLILFQNNGELRPNGGFIGSIGEISLHNGKITNYMVQDVYEPDGQLKAHIEPHYIIRRYLQPHLYLRDSNFSLNFQTSATYSAQLYNLSTGKQVDGVIAINFDVLERVISDIGPITLDSYNTTLTKDNTFDFLQSTIEKNFFPGSTGKKDVLSAVLDQLTLQMHQNPEKAITAVRMLPSLLHEKHIQFAFRDPSIQQPFTLLNLGGDLSDNRERTEQGIYDYLSVNEANIGVNKANRKISRTLSYTASLEEQAIHSTATIQLTNDFDQRYQTYLRFVVPSNSILNTVTFNGVEQKIIPAVTDFQVYEKPGFKVPSGLEVDTDIEDELTTFGFVITVPPNQRQTIAISYRNGTKISNNAHTIYSLYVNKQPGTKEYPVTATLVYPSEYTVKNAQDAQFGNYSVSFTKNIVSDEEIAVDLEK